MEEISILNRSMDLSGYRDRWTYDKNHRCWCLEDILYTPKATVPKFQRLSIFLPEHLMERDGTIKEEAKKVPVVFENNSAGYMQMPHTWLDGPRCYAQPYLDAGYVYVTCGCRGRESRDEKGQLVGKCPASLVDLKTAIRFLRHNREVLPGDWTRIISVGWSAGGAMSTLLGVTGDNENYLLYLEENGAFMEESDSVYASQIYCPIVDLEHADLAYEWQFWEDKTCEDSPAGPAETMTPFKEALSRKLAQRYIQYFNGLELRHPDTGEVLCLNLDGRSGSGYDYLMEKLNQSATKYLNLLQTQKLDQKWSVEEYMAGKYTRMVPAPPPVKPGKDPGLHHAGPGVNLPGPEGLPPKPMSLGDLVSRQPRGVPFRGMEPPMIPVAGTDKSQWLAWDGEKAKIKDLDSYLLAHRRRMKPCTSFDKLEMDSGENQAFGTCERDYVHFNSELADLLGGLEEQFPEAKAYAAQYDGVAGDETLARRVYLTNPMNFIGTNEKSRQAAHYRIRVGACDADTAFTVSMSLALKLANAGCGTVDYELVWDQPHCEADYPGEVLNWLRDICHNE